MNMHTQTPREYAQECVDTLDAEGIEEIERWGKLMMYAAINFKSEKWQEWFRSFEYEMRRLTA